MHQVWKWELVVVDRQVIETPDLWEPLIVATQLGAPCIWAKVNPEAPKVKRTIRIHGTGHPIPDVPMRHLGSFLMQEDNLVFHVFEIA